MALLGASIISQLQQSSVDSDGSVGDRANRARTGGPLVTVPASTWFSWVRTSANRARIRHRRRPLKRCDQGRMMTHPSRCQSSWRPDIRTPPERSSHRCTTQFAASPTSQRGSVASFVAQRRRSSRPHRTAEQQQTMMARAVLLLAALVVALRTSVAAGSDPVQLGIMQSYPLLPADK